MKIVLLENVFYVMFELVLLETGKLNDRKGGGKPFLKFFHASVKITNGFLILRLPLHYLMISELVEVLVLVKNNRNL